MRSNNFFDRFNGELGNAAVIAWAGLIFIGSIIALAIGAACFRLFR